MNAKEFGAYLKSLRNARKLTLAQLGYLIGYSNPYLSQIENGQKGIPSPEILRKLEGPLGVSHEELMLRAGHLEIRSIDNPPGTPEYEAERLKLWNDIQREEVLSKKELTRILQQPDITYNYQPLSDPDRQRILIMLEQLFPDRKE